MAQYSESVSRPDARALDHLVSKHASPTLTVFFVTHVYEVHPRKDNRGVDLISDVLPFGRLWYDTPDHAIGYALHDRRSHDAVIRAYNATGNVIEKHEHNGEFKEW